jgi:hypothetical protein
MAAPHEHLPVMTPGAPRPESYTEGERRNLATVREYMEAAYDSKRASADAVRHLVAPEATFEAHTTFPNAHDPLAYAQEHGGARGGTARAVAAKEVRDAICDDRRVRTSASASCAQLT